MSKYRIREEQKENTTHNLYTPEIWDWYLPWWKPFCKTQYESGCVLLDIFYSLEDAQRAIEEYKSKKAKKKSIVQYHTVVYYD
jgi:RecB family endonuclease NucS